MFLKTGDSLLSIAIKELARHRRKTALSCVSRLQGFSSENTGCVYEGADLGERYTNEERNVILGKVNKCTTDELKRYQITESRLKKITEYRDKHGSFKSVEEILLLRGMEISVLDGFCKSIVKDKSAGKPRTFSVRGELLSPALNEEASSASKTYMGIWIWGNLISWAQVDTDLNLLHWECQFLEEAIAKEGLVAVIEAVASIVSNVPQSDVYIMESDPIIPLSRMTSATYSMQLQKQRITSAVVSILGMREKRTGAKDDCDTLINNVYMMRHRTPARLFDLLIGSEIVSAKDAVDEIINGRERRRDRNFPDIYVNPDIREYYKRLDIFQREQMNWALLLTTAFLDLYVLKCTPIKSIGKNQQSKET